MKPQQRDPKKVLEKSLDRCRDPVPSLEQTESAGERVLQRLRMEARHRLDEATPLPRPRPGRMVALAGVMAVAAVLLTVIFYKPNVRIEKAVVVEGPEIVRIGQTLRTSDNTGAQY